MSPSLIPQDPSKRGALAAVLLEEDEDLDQGPELSSDIGNGWLVIDFLEDVFPGTPPSSTAVPHPPGLGPWSPRHFAPGFLDPRAIAFKPPPPLPPRSLRPDLYSLPSFPPAIVAQYIDDWSHPPVSLSRYAPDPAPFGRLYPEPQRQPRTPQSFLSVPVQHLYEAARRTRVIDDARAARQNGAGYSLFAPRFPSPLLLEHLRSISPPQSPAASATSSLPPLESLSPPSSPARSPSEPSSPSSSTQHSPVS